MREGEGGPRGWVPGTRDELAWCDPPSWLPKLAVQRTHPLALWSGWAWNPDWSWGTLGR